MHFREAYIDARLSSVASKPAFVTILFSTIARESFVATDAETVDLLSKLDVSRTSSMAWAAVGVIRSGDAATVLSMLSSADIVAPASARWPQLVEHALELRSL